MMRTVGCKCHYVTYTDQTLYIDLFSFCASISTTHATTKELGRGASFFLRDLSEINRGGGGVETWGGS